MNQSRDNKITYDNFEEKYSHDGIQTLNTESFMLEQKSDTTLEFHAAPVAKKSHKWFCRVHEQKRLRWDLWIMLLATINWFQVPYNVAFGSENNIPLYVMNGIIDVFFILDIVINFRTSYIMEGTNEEIFDFK